jgi:hypothetical protein
VAFANEGARVAPTYHDRAEEARRAAQAAIEIGASATVAPLGLGDPAGIRPRPFLAITA